MISLCSFLSGNNLLGNVALGLDCSSVEATDHGLTLLLCYLQRPTANATNEKPVAGLITILTMTLEIQNTLHESPVFIPGSSKALLNILLEGHRE